MKLQVRAHGFRVTGALYDHAVHRLRFALSRFAQGVRQVDIRLRDENGPRGGVDKSVQLEVQMHGLAPLVIQERGSDFYAAIGRGTQRAERQVARLMARRHDRLRG